MTVQELISQLQQLPQDAQVSLPYYDSNMASLEASPLVRVTRHEDQVLLVQEEYDLPGQEDPCGFYD